MTPFLQLVAQDLRAKLSEDFSRTVIVFPNKRAGLFMNEYLLTLSDGEPLWAPRYLTINELFHSLIPEVQVNDPIDTTLRIVTIYRILSQQDVSVDWFYGWAERILADFDDVDKNLADATQLFRNISELTAFSDTSYLSEDQVAELQHFFNGFEVHADSELRKNYRKLWDILGELYRALNTELAAEGLAYEGALYRRVVENLANGQISFSSQIDHYVFVGFNVLDKVEHSLFRHLKEEGRAWFYWDYDEYYVHSTTSGGILATHEAGLFLRSNLIAFPNALPKEHFDNLSHNKTIEMGAASTEAIQAQYVSQWLHQHFTAHDPKQTAVVLCNENLLQPVLHCLPEEIDSLNVTKGFPLGHTAVVTEVEHQMSNWERQKTTRPVLELIADLSAMTEEGGRAFVNRPEYDLSKFEDVLQGESYYQMYTILNRFYKVLERHQEEYQMTFVTLRRLLRTVIRQSSVPFHGEPVEGLQIMGVLETRCLDFEHIILLSAGDGILPKKTNDNSFIPYLLRRTFELTTPERRTAVYAYYFYRLIQRASLVTMTYCSAADGMSTGEKSRFMTQLMVEWPGHVHHFTLNSNLRTMMGTNAPIEKPHDLIERLSRKRTGELLKFPTLSPSSLNVYLECQLWFYYNKVLKITEPKEDTEEILPNTFGSIFHKAAELVYMEVQERGGNVTSDYLLSLVRNESVISAYVQRAFELEKVNYRILEARVIEMYLKTLLRRDAELGNFKIIGTETDSHCIVNAHSNQTPVQVCIQGTIDRMDFITDYYGQATLRVLDYKTGGITIKKGKVEAAMAENITQLFEPGGKKHYILQTFLYDSMLAEYMKKNKNKEKARYLQYPVTPVLFFVRAASHKGYDPRLSLGGKTITNLSEHAAEFNEQLEQLVSEILDMDRPFLPTEDPNACAHCPYVGICRTPSGGTTAS